MTVPEHDADALVVGAGAAGLAAAIFAARADPGLRVVVLDGARRVGAKILVSGGSRCNVTNRRVTEGDFWGGSRRTVQRVLRAFPAEAAAAFFAELGVTLHEEEHGKLFPDSNTSRTVLDALLREAARVGVSIETGQRVEAVARTAGVFVVRTRGSAEASAPGGRDWRARAVVLATGGRSLPKTGSDGFGYELARRLGHGYVATTPALVPLVLSGDRHPALSGVAMPAALTLLVAGRPAITLTGSLLWTHVGVSGPVVLDLSRHWHRAMLEARPGDPVTVEVRLNACPGETAGSLTAWLAEQARLRPRAHVRTVLAGRLPAAVADAWLVGAAVDRDATMAHLSREARTRLVRQLLETRLDVRDSRGYGYAEVTAGGVPLDEVDHATLASRVCPGLFFAGEILDVDGRLGGFNFQWAWSSGFVAGHGVARLLAGPRPEVAHGRD